MPLRFLAGTQYVTHLSEAVPSRFSFIEFGVASGLAGRPMTDDLWAFEGLSATKTVETSSFLRKKSAWMASRVLPGRSIVTRHAYAPSATGYHTPFVSGRYSLIKITNKRSMIAYR